MAYLKRGPQVEDPRDKQFKFRVTQDELDRLAELARDGVELPARTIPAGLGKSEFIRQAIGLSDPEPPKGEPGKSALDELTRRVRG